MMRSSKLFPLLTGLLLLGAPACGDDSGSSDDDVATDDTTDDATDDTDDDTDDPTDTDDDTDDPTDTDDDTDDPTDTDDDTDDPTDTDDDPTDVDGGAPTDDGGTSTDDGGTSTDDGGTSTDDGGTSTDDGGTEMDGGDEPDPLPEGACAESPEDPADGAYADCAPTLDGESCELVCDTNFVKDGNATCIAGEWTTQTCVALGSLSAVIGSALDGSALDMAEVYVKGFYDPETEECSESDYCRTTSAMGQVTFEFFPSGDQEVVIVKEGFDEIALPINIQPGSSQTVRLDALPTGFLSGNIVILLGWQNRGDLDLLLNVPGDDGQCVYFEDKGLINGDDPPAAQLDKDSGKLPADRGPETLRIKLNDAGTGPFYDGTYSVVVATGENDVRTLQGTVPTVRLIREGANGGAEVELFDLPEDAVENAHAWHVFDLHGDGTLSVAGDTESLADLADSEFACVPTVYQP